ncbi:MAG: hypothetical protein LUP91_07020 [Methylococcaceae bacterium]|jgi:hypothetical protein|nr:hypothetical protein [Methylococcaceae bacterium]
MLHQLNFVNILPFFFNKKNDKNPTFSDKLKMFSESSTQLIPYFSVVKIRIFRPYLTWMNEDKILDMDSVWPEVPVDSLKSKIDSPLSEGNRTACYWEPMTGLGRWLTANKLNI